MPHALDSHHRLAHAAARIRGFPAPETVTAGEDAGPVAAVLARTPGRARRDGTARLGAVVALDGQHRCFLRKLTAPLGWAAGTPLVATLRGAEAVVREGHRQHPAQVALALDPSGRLPLAPTLAVPATGELHLRPAADVLQQLTGWIDPPAAETAEETGTGGRSADAAASRPRSGRPPLARRQGPAAPATPATDGPGRPHTVTRGEHTRRHPPGRPAPTTGERDDPVRQHRRRSGHRRPSYRRAG